jgi:hypothetical protein
MSQASLSYYLYLNPMIEKTPSLSKTSIILKKKTSTSCTASNGGLSENG